MSMSNGKPPHILVLEAPALPDMQLSANSRRRLHYTTVSRLTRVENRSWYYRLITQVLAAYPLPMDRAHLTWEVLAAYPLPMDRVHLTWELTYPTRRIPDDDNVQAALKPLRDTLCVGRRNSPDGWYLGLIPDDSPAHIVSTTVVQRYERGVTRTRITLEEETDA